MGKKKKSNLGIIVVLVFVVMIFIGFSAWWVVKELKPQQPIPINQSTSNNVNINRQGEASKLQVNAYAKMLDTQVQTMTPVYCRRMGEIGLIADGLVLSSTERKEISVSVGDEIECISFNNTYYGNWKSVNIRGTSEILDLDNWNISKSLGDIVIKVYNPSSSIAGAGNYTVNFTMGGNQTGKFGKIVVGVNRTDISFNLGGIMVNTQGNSSINDIRLQDGGFNGNVYTDGDAITLNRLSSATDYKFEFDSNPGTPEKEPIFLEENDEVEFGAMEFEANTVGCASDENVVLIAWDKAYYRSVRSIEVKGPAGENDATTSPTNIGGSDFSVTHLCTD